METEEGYIPIDGHKVWYRSVGQGGIPLLYLQGGPAPAMTILSRWRRWPPCARGWSSAELPYAYCKAGETSHVFLGATNVSGRR